jgi:predicted aconitase
VTLSLDDSERALLAGARGEGPELAMRLVVRAAEVLGASRLIPIVGAHVDSCLYHGEATIDFVERLVRGGAGVAVPTTLNVGALDLLHPELWHGGEEAAARGRLLMDRYRQLGCRPTFTCAPYQLADRPRQGDQVAWGESNAIVFANSVLGARTERYGDFIDIAAAIVGRVPDAGLHRTAARRATLVLRLAADVPDALRDVDELYPVLGAVAGRRAGTAVAALVGLPAGQAEDRLKALGAAAASTGGVALLHVVGSTPEAPTLAAALQGGEPAATVEIGLGELRTMREALSTAAGASDGMPLVAVSIGTPHASLRELRRVGELLDGRRVAAGVECIVSTGRETLAAAEEEGLAAPLRAAGIELLVDTCSYIAPVLRAPAGPVMTDSAKWAYYAPGNIGAGVVLGSTADCVRSAIAGVVQRDASAWGEPA